MSNLLQKAVMEQAAAKLGCYGPQGSGKTSTVVQIAVGLSLTLSPEKTGRYPDPPGLPEAGGALPCAFAGGGAGIKRQTAVRQPVPGLREPAGGER